MKPLMIITPLIALLALSACGSEQPASATQQGTVAPIETTEAPETTVPETTVPEAADNLEDAVDQCAQDIAKEAVASEAMQQAYSDGPVIYRDILDIVSEGQDQTVEEFVTQMWDETFTLDSDGSLTISGAYAEYDSDQDERYWDDLTPDGYFYGVAWECLSQGIDLPARVENHIGSTTAMTGMQSDSWDDYQAQWTFHPNNGLTITVWEE